MNKSFKQLLVMIGCAVILVVAPACRDGDKSGKSKDSHKKMHEKHMMQDKKHSREGVYHKKDRQETKSSEGRHAKRRHDDMMKN